MCVDNVCALGILNNSFSTNQGSLYYSSCDDWITIRGQGCVCVCLHVFISFMSPSWGQSLSFRTFRCDGWGLTNMRMCVCVCPSPFGQSLQTQPVRLSMESPTHRSHDSAWEQSAQGTKLAVLLEASPKPLNHSIDGSVDAQISSHRNTLTA